MIRCAKAIKAVCWVWAERASAEEPACTASWRCRDRMNANFGWKSETEAQATVNFGRLQSAGAKPHGNFRQAPWMPKCSATSSSDGRRDGAVARTLSDLVHPLIAQLGCRGLGFLTHLRLVVAWTHWTMMALSSGLRKKYIHTCF